MTDDMHATPAEIDAIPAEETEYRNPEEHFAGVIEDAMSHWLHTKCPGWADVPIPSDPVEVLRFAQRLEAQILWLESNGRWSPRDHWCALANLEGRLPFHYGDDARGRIRDALKIWAYNDEMVKGWEKPEKGSE